MSEFQYYEFVAVDRPLTSAQQGELRALSTRARITPSSFVNEYQWGDLRGDPRVWVERYFDAHLYLANWGTRRIVLRLPRAALAAKTVARYCGTDSARSWVTRTHVIVDLHSDDEEGDAEWCDPEGRLAAIVPARAELAAGDLRLLYLAWLLGVQAGEVGDGDPEPPVPACLAELPGSLQALADFLRLDPDLLAAAAEGSRPAAKAPSAAVLRRWVTGLPETDKNEVILRVLRGDGALLRSELLGRFHGVAADQPVVGRRTAGQLLAAAETAWAARQRLIREREAAARRRREQAAAAAREQRLDVLARDPKKAWTQVDTLIETKRPKDYDAAVALLEDLHGLALRDTDKPAFTQRLRQLRERNARKPSLLERLDRAKLG